MDDVPVDESIKADQAQIERSWIRAQARIDEIAESGKQAIEGLVQEIIDRAERPCATS
jgi:F0F1-type ATP synthase membrane subunit b/b'